MKRNQRHSRDSMMHGMTPRDTPTPAEPTGRPSPAAHLGTLTGSLCPRDVKGVSFFSITEGTCPGAEKREQHHELPLRALDGHVRPSAPSVHPRPHAGRRTHTLPLETSRRRHRGPWLARALSLGRPWRRVLSVFPAAAWGALAQTRVPGAAV